MATSPKTPSLGNGSGQSKDAPTKELTKKLKIFVNTHEMSELGEKLDVLSKVSRLDALNKMVSMSSKMDSPIKTSALSVALDRLNKITGLDTLNKITAITEQPNSLNEVAAKSLLSFNLYPTKPFESSLKSINYPTSIEHALARDWKNVGNDLWKSYLTVSSNQFSDNNERSD
ncbi:MAG: hypothetical protein ACXWT1_03480 [Methylobacter sp.]